MKQSFSKFRSFTKLPSLAEIAILFKMLETKFTLVRDYERKPYNWENWENGVLVNSEPAEILAFYKVYLNDDLDRSFGFEIRKGRAGTYIFDHDDTLTEFLFAQDGSMKEVNDLVSAICDAMCQDYYDEPPK
jgi:hypothetical protein